MHTSNVTAEVVLPFGVSDGRGRRARRAILQPITGKGEMLGAEEPNPFRAGLLLLSTSTAELGPYRGTEVDVGVLSSLLPVDRDFLLLQLNRLSFGDIRFQTVQCPAQDCARRIDVRIDLSTVGAPPVGEEATGCLSLEDGRLVHFRLPTAGDQVEMHGVALDELEDALLERCVCDNGSSCLGAKDVMVLPKEHRARIAREVLAASPEFDMQLELECVECGNPFRYAYDPVHSLLGDLRASRSALLREIHYLAFYYHWGQTEILSLPRSLRAEYLALLDEELSKPFQGGAR